MARRMLIDASHPEETRVVVVDGTRLEEFDFETASRKPLKGNIYLAKVIRIEPSLQAAFVEYGGNRHGFLAFSEIHPDYYQIPVADRERLIAEQQRLHAEADDDEPRRRDRIDRTDIEEVREDNRVEIDPSPPANPAPVEAEAVASPDDVGETPAGDVPADESRPRRSPPRHPIPWPRPLWSRRSAIPTPRTQPPRTSFPRASRPPLPASASRDRPRRRRPTMCRRPTSLPPSTPRRPPRPRWNCRTAPPPTTPRRRSPR